MKTRYMPDPDNNRHEPDLAATTLCIGALLFALYSLFEILAYVVNHY